jgi:nickel-dependent lactate racemase
MNNVASSLRQGLLNPLGFSSLKDVLFPEDKILLVPDDSAIARPEILKELITVFLENGIEAQDISVLLTSVDNQTRGKSIAFTLPDRIEIKVFNPSMNGSLALLGIDESGLPVALCRHLVDADMVITVGELKQKSSGSYFGIHSAVFPRFANTESQQRFASVKGAERKKLQKETDNAANLLGIVFTIQFSVEGKSSTGKNAGRKTKENSGEKLYFIAGLPQLVASAVGSGSAQP